jgi:ankyrin repeat protein
MGGAAEVMAAIRDGDAKRLGELISQDASLASARDEAGVSAVLLARYVRRKDLLDILLATKPELDIFEASAIGQAARVRELLQQNPTLAQAWSADGFTPLHLACFFRQEALAKLLLDNGAPTGVTAKNPMRVTPLHSAVAAGEFATVKMLLKRGAPVNAQQQGGWTALHEAANTEDEFLVELLLEHGADPNLRSEDGRTPADMAAEKGNKELALRLRRG